MRRLIVFLMIGAASLATLAAQTAIPTREGRAGQAGQAGPGRRGGGPAPELNLPASPVTTALPTISRFPLAAYMSVALNHLWRWVDTGTVPPRGDRILVDRNVANDGSVMALDQHGNARGGIRNVYVDVPAKKYGVRNEGAVPPIPNAHPFVAVRGEAAQNQLCGLAGYEVAFSQAELKKLYKDKKDYVRRVERGLDEATKQGWFLPVYRSVVLADAAAVSF